MQRHGQTSEQRLQPRHLHAGHVAAEPQDSHGGHWQHRAGGQVRRRRRGVRADGGRALQKLGDRVRERNAADSAGRLGKPRQIEVRRHGRFTTRAPHDEHPLVATAQRRPPFVAVHLEPGTVSRVQHHGVPELDIQLADETLSSAAFLQRRQNGEYAVNDLLTEVGAARVRRVDVQRVPVGRPLGEPEDIVPGEADRRLRARWIHSGGSDGSVPTRFGRAVYCFETFATMQ